MLLKVKFSNSASDSEVIWEEMERFEEKFEYIKENVPCYESSF